MGFVSRDTAVRASDRQVIAWRAQSLDRAVGTAGHPLDATTNRFMESRFGFDFRHVRIHSDERADRAAAVHDARALTVGSDLVFGRGEYAPHTPTGRLLIAHELAHVVQATGGPTTVGGSGSSVDPAVETDADRVAESALHSGAPNSGAPADVARPTLRVPAAVFCKKRETGPVQHGRYTIDMDEEPSSGGHRENVRIEFMPDKSGPITDHIEFVQIATAKATGDRRMPWGPTHPGEEAVDKILTQRESRVHQTRSGDTLASVATEHYGVPDRAGDIYQTNQGLGISADRNAPLTAGLLLTVPDAVAGGYNVDIDVKGKAPRRNASDPNVSPNYPHLETRARTTTSVVGGTGASGGITITNVMPGLAIGRNPASGTPESAVMTDIPGGGYLNEHYRFESTAHAEDIGVTYGAVQWGFDHDPFPTGGKPPISNEFARVAPHVSFTVGAATVKLDKHFGNKHIVQQGETLRSICLAYYKDSLASYALFRTNPGILPTFDPDAALPVGKELTMISPLWDIPRFGDGGVKRTPAETATPTTTSQQPRLTWPTGGS